MDAEHLSKRLAKCTEGLSIEKCFELGKIVGEELKREYRRGFTAGVQSANEQRKPKL